MVNMEFPPFQARIVRQDEHGVVIAVRGELDAATVPALQRVVDVALSRACRLTMDLRDLTFIGSSGVSLLLSAHQRVGQIREAIVLYRPSPLVVRVLEITGIDSFFDIRTDGLLEPSDVSVERHQTTTAMPQPVECIDLRTDHLREFGHLRHGA